MTIGITLKSESNQETQTSLSRVPCVGEHVRIGQLTFRITNVIHTGSNSALCEGYVTQDDRGAAHIPE